MDKKLIEVALIAFALIFVVLMSVCFGHVVGFGNKANNNIASIEMAIVDADLEQYNNKILSGDAVISTINKMKELKDGTKMSYAVKNGSSWTSYGHSAITATGGIDNIDASMVGTGEAEYTRYTANLGDSDFINPVDSYQSKVVGNENGVVIGIAFEKK